MVIMRLEAFSEGRRYSALITIVSAVALAFGTPSPVYETAHVCDQPGNNSLKYPAMAGQ